MQRAVPCVLMRGGSSRGPFLLADDLPADAASRDAVLLALLGSPHALQVDGLGGGHPQTSKAAIISRAPDAGWDVDYLFAQVAVDAGQVDTRPNCGNMLAGVGPFAIEAGLVAANDPETVVRIRNVNTGARIDALVRTPGGRVTYDGACEVAGVPGRAAPIRLTFRDVGRPPALLPTGRPVETLGAAEATLIRSAMPMMLLDGRALGFDAPPTPERLEADAALLSQVEALRRAAGAAMGLGDVSSAVVPKPALLWPAADATLAVVYLTPWRVHRALAVTGAVTIAVAAQLAGTLAHRLARPELGGRVALRHPAGLLEVELDRGSDGLIAGAAVIRTARRLFEGRAFVPAALFDARPSPVEARSSKAQKEGDQP